MRRKAADIMAGRDEIATGTGLSPRVVERALAILVARGYVRQVEPGQWALQIPAPTEQPTERLRSKRAPDQE